MKKIMIALALMGLTCYGAIAQNKCNPTKKVTTKAVTNVHHQAALQNKLTKTYQVCRERDGYYTCCLYKNTVTVK